MLKTLTVVIPVYNGAHLIAGLLESLLKPSRDFLDVIVVNDGSTDKTAEVVSRFPVTLVQLEKNYGIAYARNRGVERAITDFIAFVDADCVVPQNWPEKILEIFRQLQKDHAFVAAMSGRVLPFQDTFIERLAAYVEHWEYQGGKSEERLKLSTSNCICDRKSLNQAGKFDESLAVDEDRELALRMVSRGLKVLYHPGIAVRHRHGRNRFSKICRHQYYWGVKTGLVNEWRYRELRKLWFLPLIKNPVIYLFILPILCSLLTLRILLKVGREDKHVFLAAPFIFIAKCCYRFGVLRWIWQNR